MTRGAGEAGFTLIEAVVALAVATLSIAAVYQLLSTGLTGVREAEARARAVLAAQSLLAELSAVPLQPGERRGELPGLRWETRITPYRAVSFPPGGGRNERAPLLLYRLEATVAWGEGEGRRLALESLRLGPAP